MPEKNSQLPRDYLCAETSHASSGIEVRGEASLHQTIVGMAQDFVGSNNLSLLNPSGQFGTRHLGGQDAARYCTGPAQHT